MSAIVHTNYERMVDFLSELQLPKERKRKVITDGLALYHRSYERLEGIDDILTENDSLADMIYSIWQAEESPGERETIRIDVTGLDNCDLPYEMATAKDRHTEWTHFRTGDLRYELSHDLDEIAVPGRKIYEVTIEALMDVEGLPKWEDREH